MYYLGVDIGGTSIKVGLVDKTGKIIASSSIKTEKISPEKQIEKVGVQIKNLLDSNGVNYSAVIAVGAGCPGAINGKAGIVKYSSNLKWADFNLRKNLEKVTGKPVRIANDADAACLGEVIFGSAKNYSTVIMLTLGTGVGGGVVIGKKLYEGANGMATELGHIVMKKGGIPCGCGRRGCFEQYASATALIRLTKQKMLKDKTSKMWELVNGDIENVNGKTAFDGERLNDKSAKQVVSKFVEYLSEGILDYCNIFRPEAIVLGGGISNEGKFLTDKIVRYLEKYEYGYKGTPKSAVLIATLKNDAGIVGAASLVAEEF